MKKNRKVITSKLLVALLVCGLLTGCGSEPGPEQGDEKVPNLPKESVLPTENSQQADIASDVEPSEAPTDFSNKPVVEEADILCSGEFYKMEWLVSKDGLLVITGDANGHLHDASREGDCDWSNLWGEIKRSAQDDAVWDFLVEHPIYSKEVSARRFELEMANIELSKEEYMPDIRKFIVEAYVDVQNAKCLDNLFYTCINLKSVDLSNLDTSNVHLMNRMFYNCKSLESLDLSNFNTEQVENMENMFRVCESLESLDLSSFDTQQVIEGGRETMFYYCRNLTAIYVGAGWVDDEASNMFEGCGVDHVTVKE